MKQSLTKRVISMLITVSMLLTMVPSVFAANPEQFKDFPKGWSKEAMEFSVDNGLLIGKSANTIEPKSNLTRAEMATIINRAFGAKITKDISAYTDVDKSDWYYTEMQKAVNMQTFQGDGNGKLRPDDSITREEVMAVIARAMVLETDDYSSISKFKDYSSVSDWAKPYVAVLIANGYVNGYEDNTVKPKANITREEFAQLMYNIFKTYLSAKDTSYTSVFDKNCVMINNEGINLSNVTVDGDLVLGDGVGTSKINLTNVTIKGRLLARGGVITLKNVTTGKGVVVKNVNGTTHFNNYRSESVFDGVVEHTYTTYLRPSYVTGGGSPSGEVTRYDVTVNYLYRDIKSGLYVKDDSKTVNLRIAYGQKYTLVPKDVAGFVFDKSESGIEDDATITVTGNRVIDLCYNALIWMEFNHPVKGYIKVQVPYGTTVEDAYKDAYGDINLKLEDKIVINGVEYDVEWTKNGKPIDPSSETIKTADGIVDYTLKATVGIDYDNDGSTDATFKPIVNPVNKDYSLSNILTTVPSEFVKEHYDFVGWFDKDNDKEYHDASVVTKTPLNIYVKWEPKKYDLVLNTNGGTIDPAYGEYDKYIYGSEKRLPDGNQMSKSDASGVYTFDAWYDNPSFTGQPVEKIPADASGTKTYYAKWFDPTVVTHKVTFVYGNGEADRIQNVEENKPATKPQDPTWAPNTFKFWSLDGVTEYDFNTPVTGDIILKAVWDMYVAPNEYTVTFVYGNGQADGTQTVIDGGKATKPQDPTWAPNTFKFWSLDGVTEYNFNTPVTGDITLKAVWDMYVAPNEYTVTFVYGNGQADGTQTVIDGGKATKPADPTWDGYKFQFWTLDGVKEYDFSTAVTGDITLKAVWTKIHKVTFVYGNGQPNVEKEVLDGDLVAEPAAPTWEGHQFEFWTADGVNEYSFAKPVTGDITITAKWTGVHIVTFKYDNGDADTTQNVVDGQKVIKPSDPTRENYTFEFWSRDGVNPYDFDMAVTESFTLTAIWKVVDTTVIHTVKFYAFPEETKYYGYAGKLEIVDGTKFGEITNEVKNIYRVVQDNEKTYELWEPENPYGTTFQMVQKGYFDAAENFQHYIRPDLVYNKNGKWESFTGDTVVTKDMEVYAVRREVEIYLEGSILGISLPSFGATLGTPYNSATRAVDSLKDAIWLSRGSFDKVFTDDFQDKIFAKLAPKSKGLIDSNGYILNKEFSMKIADVISVSELEKEIRNYITRILEEGTEAEIRELIEIVHIETFIDYIGIVKLAELVGYDVVRDAVMSADNRDTLIKYIQDELASESNDFRDILLGNTEFLEAALASSAIKDAVIDAIITNPDILINVLSVGNNRETFIDIAVNQPAFINALLTYPVFEAKIIDLVHNNDDDKAAFKALIENDDNVRNQIFDEALTHDEVVYYLEHDVTFLKHVVDVLNNTASASIGTDYANILGVISANADFKAQIEAIVGYTLDESEYNDVINDYVYENPEYDTVNAKITKEISQILTAYDPSAITGINKDITDYVVSVIDDYIANGTCDFDSHIEELVIDFVSDYLDEKIADETVEKVIDDVVLNYIEQYMNYTDSDWDALGDDDLKDFVVTIKDDFIDYAKTSEMTEDYKNVIRNFVTKEDNNSVIISLFNTYYDTMKSYIVGNATDTTVNPELHKIIKGQALADNTYNILSTFIAENEDYIKTTVLADGELEKYINKYANDSTFKTFVTDHVDLDTVIDFVMDIRVKEAGEEDEPDLDSFITEAIDMLKGLDYYKNFIKCFQNKDATYHVDKTDIHFALAVGEAVHGYTFDEALELLGGGPIYDIINKIGKDKFESIYNESRDDFNNGIKAIKDKIDADENYSEEYEMSLKMKINFAELIDEYYTKLHDKLTAKVESAAPYYYTENQYLREFVDSITVDNYLDFDASAKSEVNSGYKFKPIMEYYDLLYENLLLIDKAVLWYGPNTPEEFENLRDDIANDIIKAFDKIQSILENLDEDGKIFGSYTIKDVIARVDSLKKLGDKVPQLNTVIDNVCKILSKVEGGEVIAKGYTLDDLVELSERLDSAVATLRDEEYEKLNSELESIVDKIIDKIDEILDELDADGTILGKVSIDDLASKVDAINNIYKKFEDKIDKVIGKLADIEIGSVSGKFDTEYWEDILFGEDDYNRFDLDDIFDVACPKLNKFRVDEPYTDSNKRLVIDELKVKGGGATVTFDRYLD